jgi:dTDP-4-dehydrorhamnose reductase
MRLRESYKVFATYHSHRIEVPGVTYLPFAVENRNWVKRIVYTAQPETIIYVAGRNEVAWAETKTRDAELLHTGGPATVSNVSGIFQSKFIYVSNCYAFDGTRGNYHETDTVLPSTALGKAKVGGENYVRGKCLNYVIVRSSPVYGMSNPFNPSFLDRLRMGLARGSRMEIDAHELHSFAPIEGLVELIVRVTETGIRNRTLHYGGLTKVSHYELARTFARKLGYDANLILPSIPDSRADYSLNSTHTAELLKVQPLLLEQGLDLLDQRLVSRA